MSFSPDRPHMVTVDVSPYCELARWTLDRLGVAYTQENHVPFLHRLATRRHRGGSVVPVLDIGESSLTDARQIVDYYDARAPEPLRLYPTDPDARAETKRLFDEFYDELGVAVRAWAYAYQLPQRKTTASAWTDAAPRWERAVVAVAYPLLAKIVGRGLGLRQDGVVVQRAIIDASLARIATRLGDGRRYLVGDALTAADLALATLLAPAVLPAQYRGPLPTLEQLPVPMRRDVEQIRAHPAGAFVLRVYGERRDA